MHFVVVAIALVSLLEIYLLYFYLAGGRSDVADAASVSLPEEALFPTFRQALINSLKQRSRESAAGRKVSASQLEVAVACACRIHQQRGGSSLPDEFKKATRKALNKMLKESVARYGAFLATNDVDAAKIVDEYLSSINLTN